MAGDGARALRALSAARIERIWVDVVDTLLDPTSSERAALDPLLLESSRLSIPNLQASLEAIGGGLRGAPFAELATRAVQRPLAEQAPVLVILAANVPGLALQTLLPALLRRRPALFKSASAEPYFTTALIRTLVAREPSLAASYASATWPGGRHDLESVAAEGCRQILAYGGSLAMASLRQRFAAQLVEHGPKVSAAIVDTVATRATYDALARDIALCDQRGCLSVHALLSTTPQATALELGAALERCARELPPGQPTLNEAAAVRRFADEAVMRGREVFGVPGRGLVVLEEPTSPLLRECPGLRTVTVHPLTSTGQAVELLRPVSGQLQGIALATHDQAALARTLQGLGPLRITPPGRLQQTDALWHDGRYHPIDLL
jgi:hypothetical protein